jgi:hypothetical protein
MSLWLKGMAVRMGAAVLVMLVVAAIVLGVQRLT